jgi:dipeptidyl aminopeptidase/acylaminoacyl peptidase
VTYYFALESVDDAGNRSDLSNIAFATTRADTIAPAAAADFAIESFTGRTATLTWTSPGDDGMDGVARAFELRYSENEITAENFEDATVFPDVPAPGQPGQVISATVSGLEPLSEHYFALRTADEVPNWSSLSPVVRIETSSSWQLTFSPEGETASDPDWSPDGSTIVFRGTRNGRADLFLIPAEGGNTTELTDTPQSEYQPAWSPDGTRIAFHYFLDDRDPYIGELYVMDAVPGSKATLLARHEGGIGAPCWSPEGDAVAYQDQPLASIATESTIYSVSVAGGDRRVLVNHGSEWGNHSPAWSPDGTRMVVMSTRHHDWNLWIVPLAGGEWAKLTELSTSVFHTSPDWSPDGSEIVYGTIRGFDAQIFRISASGGEAEQLTDASANSFKPSWSPDGQRVAYCSARSGKAEVWIQIVE